MPPSPRRRTVRPGQLPGQGRLRLSASHPVPRKAGLRKQPVTSFFARGPQPFARAMQPVLPQMPKRFRRPASRSALPLHPKTAAPVPPAFHLLPSSARRSAHQPACFPAPAPARNLPAGEKSPPPSPALFSAPIRRSHSPPVSRRGVPLRASPFHTRDASAFAQSPSG